jgi:Chondroitin N-acetylgalactosaminyltransferase
MLAMPQCNRQIYISLAAVIVFQIIASFFYTGTGGIDQAMNQGSANRFQHLALLEEDVPSSSISGYFQGGMTNWTSVMYRPGSEALCVAPHPSPRSSKHVAYRKRRLTECEAKIMQRSLKIRQVNGGLNRMLNIWIGPDQTAGRDTTKSLLLLTLSYVRAPSSETAPVATFTLERGECADDKALTSVLDTVLVHRRTFQILVTFSSGDIPRSRRKSLHEFLKSINQLFSEHSIGLIIVTNTEEKAFVSAVAEATISYNFRKRVTITGVKVQDVRFSRVKYLAAGVRIADDDATLFVVDIDVKIDGNAIERCKAFSNTQFAYFPVIFMRYPSAVKHPSGYWGSTGFGIMCTTKVGFIQANAVHGEDADDFQGLGRGGYSHGRTINFSFKSVSRPGFRFDTRMASESVLSGGQNVCRMSDSTTS